MDLKPIDVDRDTVLDALRTHGPSTMPDLIDTIWCTPRPMGLSRTPRAEALFRILDALVEEGAVEKAERPWNDHYVQLVWRLAE